MDQPGDSETPVPHDEANGERKRELRQQMRSLRRAVAEPADRSLRIWEQLYETAEYQSAAVVMAFTSIPGEPDTSSLIENCRANNKAVVLPEDDPPPDPRAVDLIVVPGLAFTRVGDRLGQGGGWYDRFLAAVRPDTFTVGVGFDVQLIDELPVEVHDQRLNTVIVA